MTHVWLEFQYLPFICLQFQQIPVQIVASSRCACGWYFVVCNSSISDWFSVDFVAAYFGRFVLTANKTSYDFEKWLVKENVVWIRNCSACSEPVTSHMLCGLTGSQCTTLHIQQQLAFLSHASHLESVMSMSYQKAVPSTINLCIFSWKIQSCHHHHHHHHHHHSRICIAPFTEAVQER